MASVVTTCVLGPWQELFRIDDPGLVADMRIPQGSTVEVLVRTCDFINDIQTSFQAKPLYRLLKKTPYHLGSASPEQIPRTSASYDLYSLLDGNGGDPRRYWRFTVRVQAPLCYSTAMAESDDIEQAMRLQYYLHAEMLFMELSSGLCWMWNRDRAVADLSTDSCIYEFLSPYDSGRPKEILERWSQGGDSNRYNRVCKELAEWCRVLTKPFDRQSELFSAQSLLYSRVLPFLEASQLL